MRQYSQRLCLVFVFLLIVPGLFWGVPSALTPQVDVPLPIGALMFFGEYHRPDANTVYPAFHQLFLLPFYAVVIAAFWVTGGVSQFSATWPYGFHDPSLFFSVLIVVTNLVSAVMGVWLLGLCRHFVAKQANWAWAGLLVIGTNGVFIYYCRVGNLDLPYTFWWGIALYFLWGYFTEGKTFQRSLLPAAIAAGCSVGTKDQAVGLVIGAALAILLVSPYAGLPPSGRIRNAVRFTLVLLAAYSIAAILPHPVRWWHHARFVVSPHAPTTVPMSVGGQVQMLWLTLRQLHEAFTLPVLAIAAAGAVSFLRRGRTREFWLLVLPLLAYYMVIIAKTRVVYPRFMLPIAIPVLVFFVAGAAALAERLRPRLRAAWGTVITALIVVQLGLSYVPVTYAMIFDSKRSLAAELPALLPAGQPLIISRMQSYNFPNRDVYENYRLMMLPGDPVVPTSRHAASILHSMDAGATHFLLGSGTAGLPTHKPAEYPALTGEAIRTWSYPQWVKDRVLVPCIYEFTLYRRTGPLPLN